MSKDLAMTQNGYEIITDKIDELNAYVSNAITGHKAHDKSFISLKSGLLELRQLLKEHVLLNNNGGDAA